MKRQVLSFIAMGILSFMISGCAENRVSLADKGRVSLTKQDDRKVRILWMDVFQQDGQTWAGGVLKQQDINPGSIKTHVDVQVSNPDGSIQYEIKSEDLMIPRNLVGKGSDWKRFRVQLPNDLPLNSQISMTVHNGEHEKSEIKS